MKAIAMMYVYAIVDGLGGMTYKDVPNRLKSTVKTLLEGMGFGDLVTEE